MNELKWLHENDILVEALSAALRASAATTVWQWACVEHKVFAGVLGGTCFLLYSGMVAPYEAFLLDRVV